VSFATITLCVASQRVSVVVYFVIDSVRKLLDTPLYTDGSQLQRGTRHEMQPPVQEKEGDF
jgi:hypothetical protein